MKARLPALAFLLLPIIEIALFVMIGDRIGVLATLAAVIGAAVLGVALIIRSGRSARRHLREALRTGRDPGPGASAGLMTMLSGLLFLMPGFFTDLLALLLLLPPVQTWVIAHAGRRLSGFVSVSGMRMGGHGRDHGAPFHADGHRRGGRASDDEDVVDLSPEDFSRAERDAGRESGRAGRRLSKDDGEGL